MTDKSQSTPAEWPLWKTGLWAFLHPFSRPENNPGVKRALDRLENVVVEAERDRLRRAIEAHRDGMTERFADTLGDPNEFDTALWAALDD